MDETQVSDNGLATDNEPVQEKMLTQSQVNKIVANEKARAADSARRETEEKYQNQLQEIQATRAQQEQRNEQVPRDVDDEAMYQKVLERFNQDMHTQRRNDEMANMAKTYLSKIEKGRTAYEDFDAITQDFDPAAFPQLTFLLSGIDNAADVLYEIANNSSKLIELDQLAQKAPRMAQAKLLQLSKSISDNRQAKADADSQHVPEPLDRLQSSRVSGSNGKMGIRDLRSQDYLKG